MTLIDLGNRVNLGARSSSSSRPGRSAGIGPISGSRRLIMGSRAVAPGPLHSSGRALSGKVDDLQFLHCRGIFHLEESTAVASLAMQHCSGERFGAPGSLTRAIVRGSGGGLVGWLDYRFSPFFLADLGRRRRWLSSVRPRDLECRLRANGGTAAFHLLAASSELAKRSPGGTRNKQRLCSLTPMCLLVLPKPMYAAVFHRQRTFV